jgi:hypothetical protein
MPDLFDLGFLKLLSHRDFGTPEDLIHISPLMSDHSVLLRSNRPQRLRPPLTDDAGKVIRPGAPVDRLVGVTYRALVSNTTLSCDLRFFAFFFSGFGLGSVSPDIEPSTSLNE